MRRRANSSPMLIQGAGSRVWPEVQQSEQRRPRRHAHLTSERSSLLRPASEEDRRRRASTPGSCPIDRQARLFVTGPAVWLCRPRTGSRGTSRTTQALPRRHKRAVYRSPPSATRTERRRRWQGHGRQSSAATILGNRKAPAAEPAPAASPSEQQCISGALSRRLTRAPTPYGAQPADWLSEPRCRRPPGRRRRFGTRTRHQRRREQTGLAAATTLPVRREQPGPTASSSGIRVGERAAVAVLEIRRLR